jgi:integrase
MNSAGNQHRSKRANGEGSVTYDRVAKRYVGRITVGRDEQGRPLRRKFVGKTRAEVVKRMDAALRAIGQGMPTPNERITVGDWLSDWLARLPGTVSAGTEDTYRRVVRLYLRPEVGAIKLARLTPGHVEDLLRGMRDRGLSAETQRMARAVLRRALRKAEQEGLIGRNVAAIAEGPKLHREQQRALSVEEARRLLAVAESDRLSAAIVVMLGLGLRRGETLGTTWDDLELEGERPTLLVRRQLQRLPGRALELTDLKTAKSKRDVPLPAFAVEALRAHRRGQAAERMRLGEAWADRDGLVFTTPLGTPVDGRNFNRMLSKIATAAGLGHWHPHELRHSAVSIMLAEGVALEVVSEIVGHSSIRVTKDVYGHLLAGAKATAASAMDRALAG